MTYLFSPPMTGLLYNLRFAFIIISSVFVIALVFFLLKNNFLWRWFIEDWIEFFSWGAFGIKATDKDWEKVKKRLNTGQEPEYKLAVIEADKILTGILKKMEYKEKTPTEILEKIPATLFPGLEEVKWAHNLHESVIHDPDFRLNLEDAKKALAAYEKFFVDLEVL